MAVDSSFNTPFYEKRDASRGADEARHTAHAAFFDEVLGSNNPNSRPKYRRNELGMLSYITEPEIKIPPIYGQPVRIADARNEADQPARPVSTPQPLYWKQGDTATPQQPTDTRIEEQRAKVATGSGEVTELYNLKYSTGKHRTPDAMVYVPDGFDASKPIRVVVYNHGLETDVKGAFRNSKLKEQMMGADSNTILIVPEWQTRTPSRESSASDRFHNENFFKNMLNEVFSKTPALQGKTTDDIASVGLITHSGGFKATESQLYKNGLYDKVTSLTVLDSMYDPKGYDKWISDNVTDLASGKKHLLVVYTDHLRDHSLSLAKRMEQMLQERGISPSAIMKDAEQPKSVTPDAVLRRNGIVFKYSNLKTDGRNAHDTMTGHYVREVMEAEAQP